MKIVSLILILGFLSVDITAKVISDPIVEQSNNLDAEVSSTTPSSKKDDLVIRKWPNGIAFYAIDESFDQDQVQAIKDAMKAVEDVSCVRFRPARKNTTDYIKFIPETLCNSKLGWKGGEQLLKLIPNPPGVGCFKKFKIVHEIMHALGFEHQHKNPNRDKHVIIEWDNIKDGSASQFTLSARSHTDFGLPYDHESVMHYGLGLFSKNGEETIKPRDESKKPLMGQREKFSKYDIKKLNLYYECENWVDPDNEVVNLKRNQKQTTTIGDNKIEESTGSD